MSAPGKVPFVAPVRAINLLWLVIVLTVLWAADRYGTPHLRIEYTWSGSKANPTYHNCAYWGLHSFRIQPASGECPIVVLARPAKVAP